MKQVKNLIIGFGKAGKTLAGEFASRGEDVILVEKSKKMYGGTCINVACIPTKKLKFLAFKRDELGYSMAVNAKNELISKLNNGNYHKVADLENAEVLDGTASFINENTVEVHTEDGVEEIQAERIFINTGARPFIPNIDGLELSDRILTSESLIELTDLPKDLAIIGSGPVGLELASIYSQFGSNVTLIDRNDTILKDEDADVRDAVIAAIEAQGINIVTNANTQSVKENADSVSIYYNINGDQHEIQATHLLVATGRKPNIEDLNLGKAGITVSDKGAVEVNEFLQTNLPHIFALGDVNGGPQQTYISLDDYRIIRDFIYGDKSYSTDRRKNVPATTFIEPPLSQVGLSETAAREQGLDYKVASLDVSSIPKAKILDNQTGLYKAIIDSKTNKILGATLFGEESHEVINIISTAMIADMDYTQLRDQIFTHPTMAEALNDLFKI